MTKPVDPELVEIEAYQDNTTAMMTNADSKSAINGGISQYSLEKVSMSVDRPLNRPVSQSLDE